MLDHGWTVPNPVSMWPGRPLEWTVSQCVYEATVYAMSDAQLSGQAQIVGLGESGANAGIRYDRFSFLAGRGIAQ